MTSFLDRCTIIRNGKYDWHKATIKIMASQCTIKPVMSTKLVILYDYPTEQLMKEVS